MAQGNCYVHTSTIERIDIMVKACLSNAPLDKPWQELARVQAQRFFIEHSFREEKSECGMADYQVRRWDAWHNW